MTDKVAEGTVWTRDGGARRQRLTSSVPAIPAEACGRFPFTVR
jgi:hypothetical protein